jgi:rubrerythrin
MKSNRRNFIKTASIAGVGIAGSGMIFGCSSRKPEKTLADMKVAYIREETTEDKYNKFGQKAKEENFVKIAVMFTAIAKAEGIHGANHKKVLDKLKGNYPASPIGSFEVKSTLENLQDGLNGETYEYETMYPAFIKEANDENVPDAVDSFTWARQVEKQHQGYYNVAITAMGIKSELTLPEAWYVCPKCGGTYAEADRKSTCFFDPTPKEQFIEFK